MIKNKNILLIISFVLLAIVFSGCTKYNFKYQKSVDESFVSAKNIELLSLDKLIEIVVTSDTNNYQFIDIRTPHEFVNGHLLNAISLPLKSLYGKNCSVFCEENKILLLYGVDASQARIAYDYLSQLGVKNIYAVGGGYNFIVNNIIEQFGVRSASYNDEKARYDYAKVIASTSGISVSNSSSSNSAPPIPVVKRKKTEGNVGGCE